MIRWIVLIGFFLNGSALTAQYGAQVLATGGNDPVSPDSGGLFNNPAGLGEAESMSAVTGYRMDYIPALASYYSGFVLPFNPWVMGISLLRQGDPLFQVLDISLSAAHRTGSNSLGSRINYKQYAIRDFESKGFVTLDFGGIFKLASGLWLGALITNATLTRLNESERIPTWFRIGIRHEPFPALRIIVALEKEVDLRTRLSSGIEYRFMENFRLRAGFSEAPLKIHGGLGLVWGSWDLDYALEKHPVLSMRHELTLHYRWIAHEN